MEFKKYNRRVRTAEGFVMPALTEAAASPAAFDPNVINFLELQVPAQALSRLTSHLYHLDQGAYPFLNDTARRWMNPNHDRRRALDWSLPRLAPAASGIVMGMAEGGVGAAPQFSEEQAARAKAGMGVLAPSWQVRDQLKTVGDADMAAILGFAGSSLLPFASGLDIFDTRIRQKAAPVVKAAEPYVAALTSGEQAGPKQQFTREVSTVLDLVREAARSNAAAEQRKGLRRADVAAGVAHAVNVVFSDAQPAPMLRQLTENIMGPQQAGVNISPKVLEIEADLIIASLLSALKPEARAPYKELCTAAFRTSALSRLGRSGITASALVPKWGLRRIAKKFNVAPELAENAAVIHETLRQHLPGTIQALSEVLPDSSEATRAAYDRVRRALDVQPHAGSVALRG